MVKKIFRVTRCKEYRKAGPTDLVELVSVPGGNPLYLPKQVVEGVVYGIVHHEIMHLSGPSGTAKTSLLEALSLVPKNFSSICQGLGFSIRPLKVWGIEMAIYESPAEVFQRRSLKDGTTYDERSTVVQALLEAAALQDECYPLIWLREIGRVHTASVQGGLLNLMTKGPITLPDGESFSGKSIAWVADSNYQAEGAATHTLVTLDDALNRRFSLQITLDYLSAEQEMEILRHIIAKEET